MNEAKSESCRNFATLTDESVTRKKCTKMAKKYFLDSYFCICGHLVLHKFLSTACALLVVILPVK